MSGTPEIDVSYVASLARLDLSQAEKVTFQQQLSQIVAYVDTLAAIDVEGVEPTAHPAPVLDRMREDRARPGLTQEDLLRNAPDAALGQIRVPKVVDA